MTIEGFDLSLSNLIGASVVVSAAYSDQDPKDAFVQLQFSEKF